MAHENLRDRFNRFVGRWNARGVHMTYGSAYSSFKTNWTKGEVADEALEMARDILDELRVMENERNDLRRELRILKENG